MLSRALSAVIVVEMIFASILVTCRHHNVANVGTQGLVTIVLDGQEFDAVFLEVQTLQHEDLCALDVDAHEVKDGGCMVLIQQIRHGDCGEVEESRLCPVPPVWVDRVLHATEYVPLVLSAFVLELDLIASGIGDHLSEDGTATLLHVGREGVDAEPLPGELGVHDKGVADLLPVIGSNVHVEAIFFAPQVFQGLHVLMELGSPLPFFETLTSDMSTLGPVIIP